MGQRTSEEVLRPEAAASGEPQRTWQRSRTDAFFKEIGSEAKQMTCPGQRGCGRPGKLHAGLGVKPGVSGRHFEQVSV